MNVRSILDELELGHSPEHVLALRKLIVSLAVLGKLSPEDSHQCRQQLLQLLMGPNGKLVQSRNSNTESLEATRLDLLPNSLVDSGPFVRLGSIARIEKGLTGIKKVQSGSYPLVVTAAERLPCDHYDFEGAATIVPLVSSAGHGKASINRLHYQEGRFAVGSILAVIFPLDTSLLSARFLFEYLSAFKNDLLVSQMIGTANVSLSVGKIAQVPVPLVPFPVQRKVDNLMTICDELEVSAKNEMYLQGRLLQAMLLDASKE